MCSSSSSTRREASALYWHGSSCSWQVILRVSPRQNRIEDRTQEQEAQRKAHTLAEVHRDVVRHHHGDHKIHQGDEVEQDPPTGLPRDPTHHDGVVDRDNAGPAWLGRPPQPPPTGGEGESRLPKATTPKTSVPAPSRSRTSAAWAG